MPVAFITGGSSGIGFAAAWELAIKGYSLALFARDASKLLATRDALLEAAPDVTVEVFAVDVANRDSLTNGRSTNWECTRSFSWKTRAEGART